MTQHKEDAARKLQLPDGKETETHLPSKETINMNANSIVSETADKWFTCPEWCTTSHKLGDDGTSREGNRVVDHDCEMHDGPTSTIRRGRGDTLTPDGIRTEDYYVVAVLDGDYSQIPASSRRLVAADLRLIANILDGEAL
ncbi:hypothetical protein [Paramicrobacterium chengjingii]|uniref:Uncharacterized protein n=1 Tax=Paramicrobacterium chengjingii TaxID=2769067 RepID=A0ABX6YL49_9MICO|nr:hypothetical protein [Microbacterium chengjingii]QPZ39524.1 hypothetical protein HCR76_05565 [Microbacterium chengjingii]